MSRSGGGAALRKLRSVMRAGVSLALALASSTGSAQTPTVRDLVHTKLEDLMEMEVTSVSKKEQKLSRTGAAIYVITQADIRSSGATSVPELLRMVPGADVAQINANVWAISIRGFNDQYADKVLVLIDGRSVYSPSFSGVYWDALDVPLQDIERIEVIRGPGGTVWGANAMNGVINIITKNAKDTKGGMVSAGMGSDAGRDGLIQYGGSLGAKGSYRVFGRYLNMGGFPLPNGASAGDGTHTGHGGFRSDWDLSSRDTMTVQGDLASLERGETYTGVFSQELPLQQTIHDRMEMKTGNVLGRWNHVLANGSEMSLQVYDDYSHRVSEGLLDAHNTVDLDFEDHMAVGSRHDIVWGLGSRVTRNHLGQGYTLSFARQYSTDLLLSTFAQDEIQIARSLWLTLGSKFEHNNYTGFEWEPSGQLVWTPAKQHTVWVSAARAIRQPNVFGAAVRIDLAILKIPRVPFGLLQLQGNPDLETEKLYDFEAGYRAQVNKRLSLDLATFWNHYDDLNTAEPRTPFYATSPAPSHLLLPLVFDNKAHARDYGAELFLNWSITNRWRISPGYSWLHMNVVPDPSSQDSTVAQKSGQSPAQQFKMRSSLILPHRLEWDTSISHVGRLSSAGVPSFTHVDTRVGWHWGESLDFSIVGQNLLRPRRLEFYGAHGASPTEVERSVFARMTWYF